MQQRQYEGCVNCATYGEIASDGSVITKGDDVGDPLSDGSKVFKINFPSVKSPTLDGWDQIKNSGSTSPQQVVQDF